MSASSQPPASAAQDRPAPEASSSSHAPLYANPPTVGQAKPRLDPASSTHDYRRGTCAVLPSVRQPASSHPLECNSPPTEQLAEELNRDEVAIEMGYAGVGGGNGEGAGLGDDRGDGREAAREGFAAEGDGDGSEGSDDNSHSSRQSSSEKASSCRRTLLTVWWRAESPPPTPPSGRVGVTLVQLTPASLRSCTQLLSGLCASVSIDSCTRQAPIARSPTLDVLIANQRRRVLHGATVAAEGVEIVDQASIQSRARTAAHGPTTRAIRVPRPPVPRSRLPAALFARVRTSLAGRAGGDVVDQGGRRSQGLGQLYTVQDDPAEGRTVRAESKELQQELADRVYELRMGYTVLVHAQQRFYDWLRRRHLPAQYVYQGLEEYAEGSAGGPLPYWPPAARHKCSEGANVRADWLLGRFVVERSSTGHLGPAQLAFLNDDDPTYFNDCALPAIVVVPPRNPSARIVGLSRAQKPAPPPRYSSDHDDDDPHGTDSSPDSSFSKGHSSDSGHGLLSDLIDLDNEPCPPSPRS